MKRIFCVFLVILALFSTAALAESGCPLDCCLCRGGRACRCCPRCAVLFRAARPAQKACPASAPQSSAADLPQSSPSRGDYTTLSAAVQEQKLLNLLNQDRARNGLPALTLDSEPSSAARTKSQDMLHNGYFAHEAPTLGNAAAMLNDRGYEDKGVGENIAHHASVEKADAAFLSSQAHRTIMMGRQWDKVGIGVEEDENGFVYVTELFAR